MTKFENSPERPQVVIEYYYEEESAFGSPGQDYDSNGPLKLTNVSLSYPAYNVRVLPLVTGAGRADFRPEIITCIAPGTAALVYAEIANISPLFSKSLPFLLKTSYDDNNATAGEALSDKVFQLTVEYGNGSGVDFSTSCELLFRPWRSRTRMGTIQHMLRPNAAHR